MSQTEEDNQIQVLDDSRLLDFLDSIHLRPGEGWILRQSSTNRSMRLHISTPEEIYRVYRKSIPLSKTAREAISRYILELELQDD